MDCSPAARLGFLIPPANRAAEDELPRYLPPSAAIHFNRLSRVDDSNEGDIRKIVSVKNLNVMTASVGRAARDLAEMGPDVIVYCCTSGSFVNGATEHDTVAKAITDQTGLPSLTTSTALLAALRALAARRIFMLAPYPGDIICIEVDFLARHGVQVVAHDSIDCADDDAIRAVPSTVVKAKVLANADRLHDCDAVFISCTNLHVMAEIEPLETELGRPVITSNQVSLWAALACARITGGGTGKLFTMPYAAT